MVALAGCNKNYWYKKWWQAYTKIRIESFRGILTSKCGFTLILCADWDRETGVGLAKLILKNVDFDLKILSTVTSPKGIGVIFHR